MYEAPPSDIPLGGPPGPPLPSRDTIAPTLPKRPIGQGISPTSRPNIPPPRRPPRTDSKEESPILNNDLRPPSVGAKDRSMSPTRPPSVPKRNYVDIVPQPRPPAPPPAQRAPPVPPVSDILCGCLFRFMGIVLPLLWWLMRAWSSLRLIEPGQVP